MRDLISPSIRAVGLAGLIVIATVVAYGPAIQGGFVWDDDDYVTGNRALETAFGLSRIWFEPGVTRQYYPLVHSTFWLERKLWGLEPRGYHAVNVALHVLSALLLWRLLEHLSIPGAWFAAALFALHPVHVESVAWISERKNVLSGMLYLAAALAYLRFDRLRHSPAPATAWATYSVSLLLFSGALLSKTVTGSLPAALLLLLWWKGREIRLGTIAPLLPMLALAAPLGWLTIWMEKHSVGARGADWELSAIERCLIAGRALWFYASKLFWPRDLTFIYPRWEIDASASWQYLPPVGAVIVVLSLWAARNRLGRGPLVALLFFAGTLFPALGFFDVFPMRYSFVADHFQYLASIGLIVLAVAAGRRALGPRALGTAVPISLLLLSTLGWLTWQQGRIYAGEEVLWRDTLRKNPSCWMAGVSLGNVLERSGRTPEAIAQYSMVLELEPDNAMAHNNLGVALFNEGRIDEAATHFDLAFEIDPNDAMVHANLGDVARVRGRLDDAVDHYRQSLRLEPNHAVNHYWIGMIELERGESAAAIERFEAALRIDPAMTAAREALDRLR